LLVVKIKHCVTTVNQLSYISYNFALFQHNDVVNMTDSHSCKLMMHRLKIPMVEAMAFVSFG